MAWRAPNILLLLPDQHRFDWSGATPGLAVRTPHLDALGRRGTRFTHALCPSPLCAPSRACLASGREYDRCGVPGNRTDYPLAQTTYYRLLRDAGGYHTAGVGKFDLHKASPIWGLDGRTRLCEWGFTDGIDNAGKRDAVASGAEAPRDPYMAFLHARGLAAAHVADFRARRGDHGTHPTPLPDDAYCDNWIAENGLALLRRFPRGRPWHLVVNFAGPHEPMDITRTMAAWYADADLPPPHVTPAEGESLRARGLDAAELVQIRRNYSAMVENIDRWAGAFLQAVRDRGDEGETVVVWSSDHGEMLGDRGLWGKSQPWQPSVGIPLVVAGPGVAEGAVCTAPVSLMDLAATFLEYAGVPRPADMDSLSLRPLLEDRTAALRPFVRSGLGPWRLVFDGRYKLVAGYALAGARPLAGGGGAAEVPPLLFDLQADPWEERDLASERPDVVERLAEGLRRADAGEG